MNLGQFTVAILFVCISSLSMYNSKQTKCGVGVNIFVVQNVPQSSTTETDYPKKIQE